MSFTTAELVELKSEIENDPIDLGYAGKSPGEQSRLMETVQSSAVDYDYITAADLQRAVVGSEYLLLTEPERALWSTILVSANGEDGVNVKSSAIRSQITEVWPLASTTKTNIDNARSKPACTRTEQLFGVNRSTSHRDIYEALS